MPKEYSRTRRIAELMQRELATIIAREIHDPRVGMVTITAVRLAGDFSTAHVLFTRHDGPQAAARVEAILNRAAGFLRHALSDVVNLRTTPRLIFEYDQDLEDRMALVDKLEHLHEDKS